ncbi:MAG: hypothetical protein U0V56_08140 [Actinomycetota bacterium]
MRILATSEARSIIKDQGGLLFVWTVTVGNVRGWARTLRTSTEPPQDALEWRRFETKGFLVFVPPWMRHLPRELHIEATGRIRRRVRAFWNGCAYVL